MEDLEEYKRNCKSRADNAMIEMENEQYDEDKEIIIQNLDFRRYKLEHNLSVKDLPSEVEASEQGIRTSSSEEFKIDIENPTPPSNQVITSPIIVSVHNKKTLAELKTRENFKNKSNTIGRPPSQPEFLQDDEIPNLDRSKVYNFEMSKNCTLPQKLAPEELQRLRRKWVIIGGLVTSTALLVVIVTLALIFN